MQTTTATTAPSTLTGPTRMPVPPPRFDLFDGDALVGWIAGRVIGFRGFGDEAEAANAAWVAWRTMARRFARHLDRRPPPIVGATTSLQRVGEVEHILAGGSPIATLLRPGAGSASGMEHFGFELQLPAPASELTARSTAHLVHRALRRSGIRWTMLAREPVDTVARSPQPEAAPRREPQPEEAAMITNTTSWWKGAGTPSPTAFIARIILIAIAAVTGGALILAAPSTVTIPIAAALGLGAVVSGLIVALDRWAKRVPGPTGAPARVRRWGVVIALSVTLLVVGVVVPEPVGPVLLVVGLVGVLTARVAGALGGWLPPRGGPVHG